MKPLRRIGAIVYREACRLGCDGIVSKRLGSPKNPKAPAVRREAEEDWGNNGWKSRR